MSVSLTSDLGRRQVKLHSADCSIGIFRLVVIFAKREGRIRSAERTEVHLIVKTLLYELTFCPLMRTSGL